MSESLTSNRDQLKAPNTLHRLMQSNSLISGTTQESLSSPAFTQNTEKIATLAHEIIIAAEHDPFAYQVLGPLATDRGELERNLQSALAEVNKNQLNASLNQKQLSSLEAIVALRGRPSILVKESRVDIPDGEWAFLRPFQNEIAAVNRSVGRIGMSPALGGPYLGTGFVAGAKWVITNRHVVEKWVSVQAGQPRLYDGIEMFIDFNQEYGNSEVAIFDVLSMQFYPDSKIDLALLEVKTISRNNKPLPPALPLQKNRAFINNDNMVYTVGFPGADADRNDAAEMYRLFGSVYEKKRFAPGRIKSISSNNWRMTHDCTTLGGNSGSCVVDIATHSVIGLHYEGFYLQENGAIILADLTAGDFIYQLNFHDGRDGVVTHA